jgi:hypothetical protein
MAWSGFKLDYPWPYLPRLRLSLVNFRCPAKVVGLACISIELKLDGNGHESSMACVHAQMRHT